MWRSDLICFFVNELLIKLGLVILLAGVVVVAAGWVVPEGVRAAIAGQPYWLQIVEMMLIGDIGFYSAPTRFTRFRCCGDCTRSITASRSSIGWPAARLHPIDKTLTKAASLLPIFALGFSEIAVGIYLMLYYWQSFLIHANVRIPFGTLR